MITKRPMLVKYLFLRIISAPSRVNGKSPLLHIKVNEKSYFEADGINFVM